MAAITGDLSAETPRYMEVTWRIRNFFQQPAKLNSCLTSPSFSLAEAEWILYLYPNGRSFEDSEGYIDIFLTRHTFSIAQQKVKATFSLNTRQGKNCDSFNCSGVFDENDDDLGVRRFIRRSKLNKNKHFLLPHGTLTVHCQIIIEPSSDGTEASGDELSEADVSMERSDTGSLPRNLFSQTETPDTCRGAENGPRTTPSVQKLQTDYKKLLENEEDSDVCLRVSDKEFRAHKCILRARSSVFSAMFKHDTEEKNSGKVVIEDMDPESFPDFLQHLYSGTIDELSEENVFNLFAAAYKYDLTDLRSECKNCMKSILSVDTFCDVMIMALRYREYDLLKLAINFFAKNLKKIIVTVKWQKFLKEYDTEANELLIKALVTDEEE